MAKASAQKMGEQSMQNFFSVPVSPRRYLPSRQTPPL